MKLRREVFRNVGTCLSPHNAFLQTLGLETLSLRIEKSCANALAIARTLEKEAGVVSVNYPGLESSPYHKVAAQQFSGLFGGIVAFELEGKMECFKFMDNLKIVRRATNLNDNKTLVLHPASTIFCEYSPETRLEMNVGEGLIRLSVGIEDLEDILSDIQQGLASV
jgi:O-acetylhomoserine (thiol)-lyase